MLRAFRRNLVARGGRSGRPFLRRLPALPPAILSAVRLAARPRASPSLFALSSPLAPRRLTFSKTDRLLEYQKWYMSLPSTADASAVNETLWPPRDKQARRLWHELQRFKKQQMGGAKSHTLDLPPQSSYLRACTHHYAKLLSLTTETQASGNGRAVRVIFDAATAGSALGELEFSATALRKRKEPPDAQPDNDADADGEKADDGASLRPDDGPSGGAGMSGGAGTSGGEGAPASSSDASDAALERHRLKKAFTSRISKCVKTNDTVAATAAWRAGSRRRRTCAPRYCTSTRRRRSRCSPRRSRSSSPRRSRQRPRSPCGVASSSCTARRATQRRGSHASGR